MMKQPTDERYLAGGAALHFAPNSTRYSEDLDFFHDSEARVASAFAADRDSLLHAGYSVGGCCIPWTSRSTRCSPWRDATSRATSWTSSSCISMCCPSRPLPSRRLCPAPPRRAVRRRAGKNTVARRTRGGRGVRARSSARGVSRGFVRRTSSRRPSAWCPASAVRGSNANSGPSPKRATGACAGSWSRRHGRSCGRSPQRPPRCGRRRCRSRSGAANVSRWSPSRAGSPGSCTRCGGMGCRTMRSSSARERTPHRSARRERRRTLRGSSGLNRERRARDIP